LFHHFRRNIQLQRRINHPAVGNQIRRRGDQSNGRIHFLNSDLQADHPLHLGLDGLQLVHPLRHAT